MYTDKDNLFGTDLSVIGATGTAIVAGQTVYDLGNAVNYLSGQEGLYLLIQVATQIITGGTAGTISFSLVSSDSTTLVNTTGTASIHLITPDVLTDDAAALDSALTTEYATQFTTPSVRPNQTPGTAYVPGSGPASPPPIIACAFPTGVYQRYVGVKRTITTAATTAGAVDAMIVRSLKAMFHHPNGI